MRRTPAHCGSRTQSPVPSHDGLTKTVILPSIPCVSQITNVASKTNTINFTYIVHVRPHCLFPTCWPTYLHVQVTSFPLHANASCHLVRETSFCPWRTEGEEIAKVDNIDWESMSEWIGCLTLHSTIFQLHAYMRRHINPTVGLPTPQTFRMVL